jgi:hypothetical protein
MPAVTQDAIRQRRHARAQLAFDRGLEGLRIVVFETCFERRPGLA